MEKCKFCQADLAEHDSVCPVCGRDNSEEVLEPTVAAMPEEPETDGFVEVPLEEQEPVVETPAQEAPKPEQPVTRTKLALMIAAIVVVAAVIIGLVVAGMGGQSVAPAVTEATQPAAQSVPEGTVPADGNPDDATCKGSYTVSDEEVLAAADTVVATIGDTTLTNGQLQVYYWLEVQGFLNNYYDAAVSLGLDYTQPLDTQICGAAPELTWQQYFLKTALETWQSYQALALEADVGGYVMPQEDVDFLAGLEDYLAEQATASGFDSVEAMLAYNVGPGASAGDYIHFMELYYKGFGYFNQLYAAIQPTQEELEAFFALHEAEYNQMGLYREDRLVDVRHILLTPEDETEEGWAACEAAAQAVLDEWKAGEATEDSFALLANQYSTDPGSNTNGGLYEGVMMGQMMEPFENWCFDEARQTGDTGLVKTTYGYHVMYFVQAEPMWITYARSDVITEQSNLMVEEICGRYPMEVTYGNVSLGFLDMTQ